MKLLAAVLCGVAAWLGAQHWIDRSRASSSRLHRLKHDQQPDGSAPVRKREPLLAAAAVGLLLGLTGLGWWQALLLIVVAQRSAKALAGLQRQRQMAALVAELPTLWLLFAACQQAGLGLRQTVSTLSQGLAGETGRRLQAIQSGLAAGQSMREAIRRADAPVGSEFERGWRFLLRSETLGAPLAPLLQRLSAQAAQELRWQQEARLAKMPLWLALVTVGCFLPSVFVVTVLPQVLNFMEQLR